MARKGTMKAKREAKAEARAQANFEEAVRSGTARLVSQGLTEARAKSATLKALERYYPGRTLS